MKRANSKIKNTLVKYRNTTNANVWRPLKAFLSLYPIDYIWEPTNAGSYLLWLYDINGKNYTKVKLYSMSNWTTLITLLTNINTFAGTYTYVNGRWIINYNDLYIKSKYSMHPSPRKFSTIPEINKYNIMF